MNAPGFVFLPLFHMLHKHNNQTHINTHIQKPCIKIPEPCQLNQISPTSLYSQKLVKNLLVVSYMHNWQEKCTTFFLSGQKEAAKWFHQQREAVGSWIKIHCVDNELSKFRVYIAGNYTKAWLQAALAEIRQLFLLHCLMILPVERQHTVGLGESVRAAECICRAIFEFIPTSFLHTWWLSTCLPQSVALPPRARPNTPKHTCMHSTGC